jgi:hypothetical protein
LIHVLNDDELRDFNPLHDEDGEPLAFATEAEARAAEHDPRYRQDFIHESYTITRQLRALRSPEDLARAKALTLEKRARREPDLKQAQHRSELQRRQREEAEAKAAAADRKREIPIYDLPPDPQTVYVNLVPVIVELFALTVADENPVV